MVDGVTLVAEHGEYSRSPSGAEQNPKRPFFAEIFKKEFRTKCIS